VPVPAKPVGSAEPLQTEKIKLDKTVQDSQAFIKKMQALHGTCPTCLSSIDDTRVSSMIEECNVEINGAKARLVELDLAIKEFKAAETSWKQAEEAQQSWEKYHQLIDLELPSDVLDKDELQKQLTALEKSIQDTKQKIQEAERKNTEASAHNARIELVKRQLVEMEQELENHGSLLHELSERMSIINVLTKTFSTTGLVAYKIECLVKDLEDITNKYLVDLSDGRFQISFKINSSDKLNVVITDNGRDIEFIALSGGERARVNVATLLAIRKLMQTLSQSRINLLILDETVEALDPDGKDKLVEVLLKEEHLNTFLVSHGFTHPLLEKVNVVKRSNISKIEV
jgi:DNA repair exonuclease SbcCD ATPase subunit